MYPGYNTTKAIHEQRVRELLEAARPDQPSLFARLHNRLIIRIARRPRTSVFASKSLEQTS